MDYIDELKDAGYEVTDIVEKRIYTLYRSQYMDNGYGLYFYADIVITYDEEEDEVIEVLVDGLTHAEHDEILTECVKECAYQEIFDECRESLCEDDPVLEKVIEYLNTRNDVNDNCGKCMRISMCQGYFEMIESGGY